MRNTQTQFFTMRKKDIATDIKNFIAKNYADKQRVCCSSELDSQFKVNSLYEFKVDESMLEEVLPNVWSFKGSCKAVIVDNNKTASIEVSCKISGNAQVDTYKNPTPIPESGDDKLPSTRCVEMNILFDLSFLDTK